MAEDHHDRTMRVHPLGGLEVVDAVSGNDICQVILWSEQTLSIKHVVSAKGIEGALFF